MVGLGDGVDERHQPARDEDGSGHVVALGGRIAALVDQEGGEHEPEDADRNVDEEDPVPAQKVGEDASEQDAGDGSERPDAAPGAECHVPFLPLGEGRHQDGERRRRDDRRAEPLHGACADQRPFAPGEPGDERGGGEEDDSDQEHPAPSEEVSCAPTQQQEAAEEERIGADHPLQIFLGEAQVDLD